MSSLLITGAGFVGSWVARELLDLGHKATLFDVAPQMDALRHWVDPEGVPIIRGDLQNIPEILDAIEKSEAEAVLHLASFLTAGVRERPYAGVQVNLMGTVNVLEAARLKRLRRVVFCSSASVYGGVPRSVPAGQEEDFLLRAVSERPRNLYAVCKLASEQHRLHVPRSLRVRFCCASVWRCLRSVARRHERIAGKVCEEDRRADDSGPPGRVRSGGHPRSIQRQGWTNHLTWPTAVIVRMV